MAAPAKSLLDNSEFIEKLARYAEKSGLTSEAAIRKKYQLPDDVWEGLANDEELVSAIEARKIARIRNGACARERAQQLFATAPEVLGKILNDDSAPPRHRIESAKELRAVAANTGPEAEPGTDERFTITINLSADEKIRIDKQIGKVHPNDGPIVDVKPQPRRAPIPDRENDDMPQELLPLFAASKRQENGGGEPL